MAKIYMVFDGPRGAFADTIKAGENLMPHIKKYNATIVHVCSSATEAGYIAAAWNEAREAK